MAPKTTASRAIFGEKAADVKDTSLTVPSGTYGIVMDVKVSSRHEISREKLTPSETKRQLKAITEENRKKKDELTEQLTDALSNILLGEKIPLDVVNAQTGESYSGNRKNHQDVLRKLANVYDTRNRRIRKARAGTRSESHRFLRAQSSRRIELDLNAR